MMLSLYQFKNLHQPKQTVRIKNFKKYTQEKKEGRNLRLATEKAKAQGLPSPKKVGLAYRCKECGHLQNKETGHSLYYRQTSGHNEEGEIPKSEWRKQKAEETEAKKCENL